MLKEQQLKDWGRCKDISCYECSNWKGLAHGCDVGDDVVIDTALYYKEKYEKAMDMLRKLEYGGSEYIEGKGWMSNCPVCEFTEGEGHDEECELAALLKEGDNNA